MCIRTRRRFPARGECGMCGSHGDMCIVCVVRTVLCEWHSWLTQRYVHSMRGSHGAMYMACGVRTAVCSWHALFARRYVHGMRDSHGAMYMACVIHTAQGMLSAAPSASPPHAPIHLRASPAACRTSRKRNISRPGTYSAGGIYHKHALACLTAHQIKPKLLSANMNPNTVNIENAVVNTTS